MPYYIEKDNKDCKSGWAVTGADGTVHGCHTTKESAIKQAVAISISTDEPFVGERAAIDSLEIGDFVSWDVLDPEILAEVIAVEGEMAVVKIYDEEDGVFEPSDKLLIINVFKIDKVPRPELTTQILEEMPQTEQPLPDMMRMAGGDPIVISDIDDTLLRNGTQLIQKTWDYIESLDADLYLVTGRPESDRQKTEMVLADAGVEYEQLIMNTGSTADSAEFKKATAEELLKSFDVVVALENDATTLTYYRELGIDAKSPESLPESSYLNRAKALIARIDARNESDSMTEAVMDEARNKWLKAAYVIKSKIEGTDNRALGKTEVRTNHIEMRATGDGRTFEGYASVFDQPSEPLPFIEYVRPGAFKRSLQSRNRMMLLWNHDSSNPLASTRNGSLQLTEDNVGLKVTATLPDTTLGRDIAELVRTGVIDSMSFGFSVKRDSWSKDGQTRYLEDVTLYEVSLVSTPAYEGTAGTVSVRSGDVISADVLADALMRIESGEEINPEQGALIADVIGKLVKTPEVEAVNGDILALKQKKLQLLMKEAI